MDTLIGHEKLYVYQAGLKFISWSQSAFDEIESSMIVLDHWSRAADSVVENIANGNTRRSRCDRNHYFNIAIGSALESAACLDICHCRHMLSNRQLHIGKNILKSVVNMTIKLRDSKSDYIREMSEEYISDPYFSHEKLDAYKVALELIVWFDKLLEATQINTGYAKRLDKSTTSLVLNIAEGNGRFSDAEQIRFLDIAQNSAIRTGVCLDILSTKFGTNIDNGKNILARIVPLILGLRNRLDA